MFLSSSSCSPCKYLFLCSVNEPVTNVCATILWRHTMQQLCGWAGVALISGTFLHVTFHSMVEEKWDTNKCGLQNEQMFVPCTASVFISTSSKGNNYGFLSSPITGLAWTLLSLLPMLTNFAFLFHSDFHWSSLLSWVGSPPMDIWPLLSTLSVKRMFSSLIFFT